MRVALAQFLYETNTFNPQEATLDVFTQAGVYLTVPTAVHAWSAGGDSQLQASLETLVAASVVAVPAFVAVCGAPGGRLGREAYAALRADFLHALRRVLPADALLLHLHGAVAATGTDDVEGDLLEAVRRELRFAGRVVVSLDLHAHVTPRMLQHSDLVTGYRTFPHQDFAETGRRAARLLLDAPTANSRTLAHVAALIPPTATHHAHGHFAEMLRRARAAEAEPGISDVSLFPVQPWMDVAELCTSVVVTASDPARGATVACELARSWWESRAGWDAGLLDWSIIITRLTEGKVGPWFLVDTADATTGGATGDSAEAIAQLWPRRDHLPGDVFLWVVDPHAATSDADSVALGSQQFSVTGPTTFRGECRFTARGGAYTGQTFSCGPTRVLAAGRLRIVITTTGSLCADPAFYECVCLKPADALAVQVKSLMGWQAGYGVPPERGLRFDGPGATSLHFARLPFTGARRELYPLQPEPVTPVTLWQSI
ncbi:MAG: M81 family metallopeptidase [Cephaloticoccus sp.]